SSVRACCVDIVGTCPGRTRRARGAARRLRQGWRKVTELVRIAAVGDVHCTKNSDGTLQTLFAQMVECADVVALAGDLVDYGLAEEAHVLVREIGPALKANVPVVAVLGNHDFESGAPEAVRDILCEAGIVV